jgi:hypothetical protein
MTNIPALCDRCNSWIITDNGQPVIETWSRDYVETIASREMPGIVIYTALQWLQHFNTLTPPDGGAIRREAGASAYNSKIKDSKMRPQGRRTIRRYGTTDVKAIARHAQLDKPQLGVRDQLPKCAILRLW